MASSAPDARAVAWFSAMLAAAQRGNFEEAANAQRELAALGWRVNRLDGPRPKERPTSHQTARRQGGGDGS